MRGLQIGGRVVTNFRCADDIDIILLATSKVELQELVDRLDRVSRKYSLLVNVDKTKVMASDGIACRILMSNWNFTFTGSQKRHRPVHCPMYEKFHKLDKKLLQYNLVFKSSFYLLVVVL